MTTKNTFNFLKPALPVLFFSLSIAQSSSVVQANSELNTSLSNSIYNQLNNDFAASYASVVNTGNNAEVDQSTTSNTTIDADTTNDAEVTQTVNATANTGYNEASRNISIGGNAGIITTGDALVNTVGVVEANNSGTAISSPTSATTSSTDVNNTGDDTSVISHDSLTTDILLSGNNQATIYQGTTASTNTGNNVADRNISLGGMAGVITTGDAGISSSYLVAANNSVMMVGGEADDDGPGTGASIIVDNTGENTRFTFSNLRLQQLQQTSENSADVTQTCGSAQATYELNESKGNCEAITGFNTSNRNISKGGDAGVITTGDAAVVVDFTAALNNSESELQLSNPSAASSAQVTNTGNNTEVDSSNTLSNNLTSSVFQQATVNQSVNAVADTGHNTANRNISIGGDAGVITTGNAYIDIMLAAFVNNSENSF